ncbi:MAG: hypothetical protein GXO76_01430 [Calditrichaeota bacterium]|nr:hypothetical protein [Calditrichota bacterium]
MKIAFLILFFSVFMAAAPHSLQTSPGQSIQPYVDFIKNQETTAKDYILNLFKKYDLVMICERDHRDITQYDLYLSILRDPYFVKNVGHVFTEVGVSTLNPELNRFMHNDRLSENEVEEKLLYFQRNAVVWPLWEKYNYHYFLKEFYAVNRNLPAEMKINFYPSDVPFNWDWVKNEDDLKDFWQRLIRNGKKNVRDSIMAAQIIDTYDSLYAHSRRKKALIIMNYRHAFNDSFDPKAYNTGRFLFQKYRGRIANVLVNNYMVYTNPPYSAIQRGKWDAAFQLASVDDIGFNLRNSPFGKDSFDYYPDKQNLTYQDVFTGMVFYKPLEKFKLVIGIPGIVNKTFLHELLRREKILWKIKGRRHTMSPDELMRYYNGKRSFKLSNLDKIKKEIHSWME